MLGKLNLLSITLAIVMLLGGQLLIYSATHAQDKDVATTEISIESVAVEITDLMDEGKSFTEAVEVINRRYKAMLIDNPETTVEFIYSAIVRAATLKKIDLNSTVYRTAIALTSDKMINEFRIPEEVVVNEAIDADIDVIVLTETLPPTAAGRETPLSPTTDTTIQPDLGSVIRQPVGSGGSAASPAF